VKNPSKSIHKFWSNIIFYFRIWIKVYPQFIILLILAVPSGIVAAYSMSLEAVFIPLMSVSFLMVIMNAISTHISMKLMEKGIISKTYLNSDIIFRKITSLNYNKLVDSDTQDKIAKVKEIMSEGDKGTMHQFGRSIVLLFTSLFGILYFAVDIVKIGFVLLGIIILTSSINALYGILTNHYQSKNMEQISSSAKKANYLRDIFQNRQFFKDIRMYNMAEWLTERFNAYTNE
jgi:ATP-binding cassette subfamily B protein